jgi:cytochrome c
MLRKPLTVAAALLAAPLAVQAQDVTGDAAAGEEAFSQCVSCHVVESPDGETLAGRGAQTGPNLYGVAMRQAGIIEGFRYSDSMVEAGEAGMVWDEANFAPYLQDPTGHLREVLDDRRARGKMTYRLRGGDEEALNIYAYLAQFGAEGS